METGCPYPLNEDDPPVTRLIAMAPACHASPCPSLSPTFIRQHLPDNRMRRYPTRHQALGPDLEREHLPWPFHARFRMRYLHVGKDGKVTYANKIISHTAKYDHHSFTMGQIAANLTINSHRAVLQLIHFQNCQWIQVTYFCEVGN